MSASHFAREQTSALTRCRLIPSPNAHRKLSLIPFPTVSEPVTAFIFASNDAMKHYPTGGVGGWPHATTIVRCIAGPRKLVTLLCSFFSNANSLALICVLSFALKYSIGTDVPLRDNTVNPCVVQSSPAADRQSPQV